MSEIISVFSIDFYDMLKAKENMDTKIDFSKHTFGCYKYLRYKNYQIILN